MSILTEFLCKFPTKTGKWKIIHNKVMGSEMILKKKSSRIKPTACCGCSSRHEARFCLLNDAVWGESSDFVNEGTIRGGVGGGGSRSTFLVSGALYEVL